MIETMDESSLRARLTAFCRDARVPGAVVAVHTAERRLDVAVGHHDLAANEALDVDASFELGCVAKPLLAAATIELARRGRLNLDDPLERYLPELGTIAYGREVCVSHLLSHTSGYVGTGLHEAPPAGLDWPGLIELLARSSRLFHPGVVFSYEHSETVLLGRVLAARVGERPESLIERLVLGPAGVSPDAEASAGRHGVDKQGRLARMVAPHRGDTFWQPGFGLALSIPALARAARFFAGQGRQSLLAPMQAGAVVLPPMVAGPACPELPVAFGRGIARFRGGWLGASGIGVGQSAALRFNPGQGTVVALALNVLAPGFRDALLAAICRDLVPAEREPAATVGVPLDAFVGDYRGSGDGFIRARGTADLLELEIGSRRTPRRLRAQILRNGHDLTLDADLPHLAIGLSAPNGSDPWLMLGLTAFGRSALTAPNGEI